MVNASLEKRALAHELRGQRTFQSLKARNRLKLQMRSSNNQEGAGSSFTSYRGCQFVAHHLSLTWNSVVYIGSLESAMMEIRAPWVGKAEGPHFPL